MADRPSAPTGTLDLKKSYVARFKTQRGEFVRERMFGVNRRAQDRAVVAVERA